MMTPQPTSDLIANLPDLTEDIFCQIRQTEKGLWRLRIAVTYGQGLLPKVLIVYEKETVAAVFYSRGGKA